MPDALQKQDKIRLFRWISATYPGRPFVLQQNDGVVLPAGQLCCFTKAECEQIIRQSDDNEALQAITVDGAVKRSYDHRNTQVRLIYPNDSTIWIYDKLEQIIAGVANHFKFEVVGFFEGIQVYHYPPGGYFDWHMDIGKGSVSTRKLAITMQLSEPDSYEGGDLEFMSTTQKAPRAQGTVVIFPTYMTHRVTTITKGSRYSMVTWIHGPPFR